MTDRVLWARDMWEAVAAELPHLTPAAKALVVAHAAYESGFGAAKAARRGFNVFNITAGSAWRGDAWDDVGGDTEYDGAGNVTRITQRWRIYADLRAAVRDYWSFLGPTANRGRYVRARAQLEAGNAAAFAQELYAAGYFTLQPSKYAAQLGGVLDTVTTLLG